MYVTCTGTRLQRLEDIDLEWDGGICKHAEQRHDDDWVSQKSTGVLSSFDLPSLTYFIIHVYWVYLYYFRIRYIWDQSRLSENSLRLMSSIYSIVSYFKSLRTCSCLLYSSILDRCFFLSLSTKPHLYTHELHYTRGDPWPWMNQVPAYATKRPTLPAEVMLGVRLPTVT